MTYRAVGSITVDRALSSLDSLCLGSPDGRESRHTLAVLLDRIHIDAAIPPDKSAEIASVLGPLAEAGYTVTVVDPSESADSLGWRILLNAPGRHVSFRIPTDASPAKWAAAVARAIRQSN